MLSSFLDHNTWTPLFLVLSVLILGLSSAPPAAAQVNVQIGSSTTLDGGTARLNVSGDWTNDGTFSPDESTVVFDGDGAQSITGTDTFFGLGVDKDGATTASLSLDAPTTVQGALDLLGGTLDNSTNDVSLSDGVTIRRATGELSAAPTFGVTVDVEYVGDSDVSTGHEVPDDGSGTDVERLSVTGAGTVSLTKAVTVTKALALKNGTLDNSTEPVTVDSGATVQPGGGALTQTPTYEGPVEITYEDDEPLTTGVELPDTTDRLTVMAPAGLTLAQDLEIAERLLIADGTMNLNGFAVTLLDSAVLQEQPGAVVRGDSGRVQATRTLFAPNGENVAGLGFSIDSDADLGTTTVVRTHARPFDGDEVAAARVYDVSPTTDGGLDATIVVEYDETELVAPDVEDPLRLYVSTDSGRTWTSRGGTVDTDANTVTLSGVDTLSQWTVGAPEDEIPVELTQFDTQVDGESAVLRWETASETNNVGFEVQHRGPEAQAFDRVAFVDGAGTTTEPVTYRHRVPNLVVGTHTFRLRQVDADGTATLTDPVEATVGVQGTHLLSAPSPNPFRRQVRFTLAVGETQDVSIELFDLIGRHVRTLHNGPVEEERSKTFRLQGTSLGSGIYFLRVRGEHFTETQKIVRVR